MGLVDAAVRLVSWWGAVGSGAVWWGELRLEWMVMVLDGQAGQSAACEVCCD